MAPPCCNTEGWPSWVLSLNNEQTAGNYLLQTKCILYQFSQVRSCLPGRPWPNQSQIKRYQSLGLGNQSKKSWQWLRNSLKQPPQEIFFLEGKTKQNKTKLDVSYTFLEENQRLNEVHDHLSIQQVSALGNTNVFTEVKKKKIGCS